MSTTPTQLYRHYDADDRLLYVGISFSTVTRLQQHMAGSQWAAEITRVEIEQYSTREAAEAAEKQAIMAEKPLWNVIHNAKVRENKKSKKAAVLSTVEEIVTYIRSEIPLALQQAQEQCLEMWVSFGSDIPANSLFSRKETECVINYILKPDVQEREVHETLMNRLCFSISKGSCVGGVNISYAETITTIRSVPLCERQIQSQALISFDTVIEMMKSLFFDREEELLTIYQALRELRADLRSSFRQGMLPDLHYGQVHSKWVIASRYSGGEVSLIFSPTIMDQLKDQDMNT